MIQCQNFPLSEWEQGQGVTIGFGTKGTRAKLTLTNGGGQTLGNDLRQSSISLSRRRESKVTIRPRPSVQPLADPKTPAARRHVFTVRDGLMLIHFPSEKLRTRYSTVYTPVSLGSPTRANDSNAEHELLFLEDRHFEVWIT